MIIRFFCDHCGRPLYGDDWRWVRIERGEWPEMDERWCLECERDRKESAQNRHGGKAL